jgi:hypothetical protein
MTEVVKSKTSLPSDYDPEKGLKTVEVAGAAERYFAKAKDMDGLTKAVEAKIDAQAEYIVWRDGEVTPSQETGSSGVKGRRVDSGRPDLPAADPGKDIAHRWRDKFTMNASENGQRKTMIDPGKIAEAKLEARERCRQICELEGGRAPGEPKEVKERPAEDVRWITLARKKAANDGFVGDEIRIGDDAKITKDEDDEGCAWVGDTARVAVKVYDPRASN